MDFEFRDVDEFQEKYRTREEKEAKLLAMDYDEIMHLAYSCSNISAAAYYGRFAELAKERDSVGGA